MKPKLGAVGIPVVDAQSGNKRKKGAGPAHTEIQREMFSKAASRVAPIVTKQRQQEADRLARKQADTDLCLMEGDDSFRDALAALHTYCDEYRIASGKTDEFLIRPRQITGWDRVLRQWSSIANTGPEQFRDARVEAVKAVQESDEEKKFGDPNLFFGLAEDRFAPAWYHDGKTDPAILERFVKGMKARSDSERLKVAAFRHPDSHRNPIFCQFGVSRPTIHFRRLKAFTNDPAGNDPRAVGMLLWHPASKSAKLTLMHGVSQRLDREIGSACDEVQRDTDNLPAVSRRGRLGSAAGGLLNADSPARVAGVFDLKAINSRSTNDEKEDSGDDGDEVGKLKEPKWNGTLSAGRRELETIGKLVDKGDIQRADRRRKQLRWTLTVSMEMEGHGPWFRYVATARDQAPFVRTARKSKPKDKNDATKGLAERKGDTRIEPERWPWQEFNRPLKDSKDGTALVEDTKAARGDKACLILSRLPGLRVLSVDLGHRYAAASAAIAIRGNPIYSSTWPARPRKNERRAATRQTSSRLRKLPSTAALARISSVTRRPATRPTRHTPPHGRGSTASSLSSCRARSGRRAPRPTASLKTALRAKSTRSSWSSRWHEKWGWFETTRTMPGTAESTNSCAALCELPRWASDATAALPRSRTHSARTVAVFQERGATSQRLRAATAHTFDF
jgi:hypothetical protein